MEAAQALSNKSKMRHQLLQGELDGNLDHHELLQHNDQNIDGNYQNAMNQGQFQQMNQQTTYQQTIPNLQQQPLMQQQPMGMQQQQPMGVPQQFIQQQPLQQQPMGVQTSGPYNSSYDMTLPPAPSGSSSRKASMTSQSGINRFFKRNKQDDMNFNEDAGADIGELTNGANISLNDITHIRDRGAYAHNSKKRIEDTTPLIPMVGGAIGPATKSNNNVLYRKQMNQQMKKAYASGSRAMSMNNQGNPMDQPRTMSFNSFGAQGPRTMSLMSNNTTATSIPSGSLTSNGGYPLGMQQAQARNNSMNNQQFAQQGPRSMSMRNIPYNAQGPRTMSLSNLANNIAGGYQNQPNQFPNQNFQGKPMGYQATPSRGPGYGPGPVPGSNQFNQQGYPPQGRSNSFQGNQPPMNFQGQSPIQNQTGFQNQGNMAPVPNQSNYNPTAPYGNTQSKDSLTNVAEEDEDSVTRRNTLAPERTQAAPSFKSKVAQEMESESPIVASSPKLNKTLGEDVVYTDDDVSQKSPLKKSNSIRLRKLDLFNNKKQEQIESTDEEPEDGSTTPVRMKSDNETELSPTFNARNSKSRYSTYTTDDEDYNNRDNYRTIGASAGNKSNATTLTNDVFVTASDFTSPNKLTKDVSALPSPNILGATPNENDSTFSESNDTDDTADTIKPRDLSEITRIASSGSTKLNSYKSIVANTAFNNFRSASAETTPKLNHTRELDTTPKFADVDATPKQNTSRDLDETPKQDTSRDLDGTPKFSAPSIFTGPPTIPGSSDKSSLDSSLYSSTSLRFEQPAGYTYSQESLDKSSNSRDAVEYSSYTTNESPKGNESEPAKETTNENAKMLASAYGDNHLGVDLNAEPETEPIEPIVVGKQRNSSLRNSPSFNNRLSNSTTPLNQSSFQTLDNQVNRRSTGTPQTVESKVADSFKPTTNDLTYMPVGMDSSTSDSRRGSRNMSLTNKSKNFFKRLSKGNRKSSINSTDLDNDNESFKLSRHSYQSGTDVNANYRDVDTSKRPISMQATPAKPQPRQLHFTKEELGIMNCNNDLVTELELVTTELASSIKRELALEGKLKNNINTSGQTRILDNEYELTTKAKAIIDLQEKLNKERRLRFISEEHALMLEHGQEPSALKINYEKNEIYKQLLIKNDMVNQLEDKLAEYEGKSRAEDATLLDKYNELLKENTDIKFRVIPELERKYRDSETRKVRSLNRSMALTNDDTFDSSYDESQEEISALKSHREELRETVSKMTASHNHELRLAFDRIRMLESKVQNLKSINDKLTKRVGGDSYDQEMNPSGHKNIQTKPSMNGLTVNNQGGKLAGFSIVSPKKNLFG